MTLRKLHAVIGLGCLLAGCATVGPIEISGDPAALAPFRTFRIHEEQYAFATDISDQERSRVAAQLRQAAVSALNARGYQQASDPDVLVALGAISRPTLNTESDAKRDGGIRPVDTSVFDAGGPAATSGAQQMPAGVGREGDLILHLLDPKTERALWRATSNGSATTPGEALRRARATYAAMVAKLPRAAAP